MQVNGAVPNPFSVKGRFPLEYKFLETETLLRLFLISKPGFGSIPNE